MRSRTFEIEETAPLRVEMRLDGEALRVEIDLPIAPTTPKRMLPLFREVADEIVARGARAATAGGGAISCKAGCSACCNQIIPVSATEARRIAELVSELPPTRRDAVKARFARTRNSCEEAGFWPRFEAHATLDDAEVEDLATAYFALQIPCPFIEEQRCSIYEDRPLACREALVTSPAVNCAAPASDAIDIVPLAARASIALSRLEPLAGERKHDWIPLLLALAFDDDNPDEPSPRPASEIAREFAARLAIGGGAVGSPPPIAAPAKKRGR